MAYHSDPDGPVIDKGAFRARIIEVCGIVFLGGILIFILTKIFMPNEKKIDVALDITKLELRYSPYLYSITHTDDVVTVTLWGSGLAAESKKAFDGDPEQVIEWEKTKKNILEYIEKICLNLAVSDVENVELVVKLVNENNHDRVLLVFTGADITYDIVRDSKGG